MVAPARREAALRHKPHSPELCGMNTAAQTIFITWQGASCQIEYACIEPEHLSASPTLLFLHEGLGCVALWRGFPQRLCNALGLRGLVYSRPGYGRSSPRAAQVPWGPNFLHEQALEVLPALLQGWQDAQVLAADSPLMLVGHSDGASIALIHAAAGGHQDRIKGVVALAPHLFVEAITLRSIQAAKTTFVSGLRERLAPWHADVDGAFQGWSNAWTAHDFAPWSIEAGMADIRCPVLAIQGWDDAYGTMAQIDALKRAVRHCQLLKLAACGHAPQQDQPQAVLDAVRAWALGLG